MKVLIGLSGGVDSAVAALLLQEQGHELIGATMRIWPEGRYAGGAREACLGTCEASHVELAQSLCQQIGIPYYALDCSDVYDSTIIAYYRNEYLAGRTPNPCVFCNAQIKFGLFPQRAQAAGIAFDAFATGHYAQVDQDPQTGRFRLLRATQTAKDQSYFLYRLSQEQLARQIFPIGTRSKPEVRAFARSRGLDVAERPDSQDFYSGDIQELIGAKDRRGEIVHTSGKVLGYHSGFWKFTIGQRKGIGIAAKEPLYVAALDATNNRVIVGSLHEIIGHDLVASQCNWVSIPPPTTEISAAIKVRSAHEPIPGALIKPLGRDRFAVHFQAGIRGIAPGQSAVFYQDNILLGGGIIESATTSL